MNETSGFTRTVVKLRYALLTSDGFVPSHLPGWNNVTAIVNISPAMGAHFSQLQITFGKSGKGSGNTGPLEYLVYVVQGECAGKVGGKKVRLDVGGYVFLPPKSNFDLAGAEGSRLLIFQKKFKPLKGSETPKVIIGNERDVDGKPFLGNKDARLQVLLPDELAFDMAVNIFTYQPKATLPFVETHVMEHGLLMLAGEGIYQLDNDRYPVKAGDIIWMAPFCPQWFVAKGKSPASYIYYKDVNRAPMQ